MPRPHDRRLAGVIAASAALHLGVLALLALKPAAPAFQPYDDKAIPVTLAPVYLVEPKPRGRSRQSPAPVRPRQARRLQDASPVAPIYVAPQAPQAVPAPGPSAEAAPAVPSPQLGRALKFGGVGCDRPDLAGLSAADRDRCAERLGAGARTAAYLGQGLSRDKQRLLDQAAAAKEAYRKYRDAPMPPGLSGSGAAGGITGLGDTAHGKDNTHHF
jgi:hypothetical protein